MKMYSLLTFAALLLSFGSFAQPVLNRTDVEPQFGDAYTINRFSWDGTPPTVGANQTWDFTGLSADDSAEFKFEDPSTAPSSSSFPDATVVMNQASGAAYEFYNFTDTAYLRVGIYGSGVPIPYSDPEKLLDFPFSYGDSYTDQLAATFTSGATLDRSGTVTVQGVGYGTLKLPNITIDDVLCVKVEEDYSDYYQGSAIYTYDIDIYMFYKEGVKYPVLGLTSFDVGSGATLYGNYFEPTNTGIAKALNAKFVMYPNPVVDVLNINLPSSSTNGNVSVEIYSLTGELVYQSTNRANVISVAEFKPGVYFAHLRNNDHVEVRKFMKR